METTRLQCGPARERREELRRGECGPLPRLALHDPHAVQPWSMQLQVNRRLPDSVPEFHRPRDALQAPD